MFETPKAAGAPKARLDFVENEQRVMGSAPLGQALNILEWGEVGTDTLVGFHQDARNMLRLEPGSNDELFENLEPRVLLPVSVWKRRVENCRVKIHDPRLLSSHAAGLLRAQGPPVKTALKPYKPNLFFTKRPDSMGPCQF